jgi:hypothetical protein
MIIKIIDTDTVNDICNYESEFIPRIDEFIYVRDKAYKIVSVLHKININGSGCNEIILTATNIAPKKTI